MHNLKIAQEEDFDEVLRMVQGHVSSSPYAKFPVSEDKVRGIVTEFLTAPKNERIAILAEVHGKVIGCVGAMVTELPFSRTRAAVELIWWVDEEFRGGRIALDLIGAYLHWHKNIAKTEVVSLSAFDNTLLLKLDKYYKRLGFVPTEHTYLKGL